MSGMRSSENYIWSVHELLGQGATGSVYKCREKVHGQCYAVKVFNSYGQRRPETVKNREIEVLQKLEHPNIVRLISLEVELGSRFIVLVMELCETSLYEILEQPENMYGLNEDDFKDVIRDVTSGMKYLRDSNIVHRDVKPGNILRSERNWGMYSGERTGSYIYKITDFGAARELAEADQPFMSIYGTEEYLHPDMYEKAVLNKSSSKEFSANVDLWSLGVTFYHLATGELPFRPAQGKRDKITMFNMTTQKKQGVISCHQDPRTQQIFQVSKLPGSSCISPNLQNLISPILAALLERNPEYMLSHDDFFNKIADILSMKVLHLYSTNTSSMMKLYLKPSENLSNLQDKIAVVLDISKSDQQLYYNGKKFEPDSLAPISSYEEMTVEKPLILHTIAGLGQNALEEKKFPLTSSHPTSNDVAVAKLYAGMSCALKTQAETLLSIRKAILLTHETLGMCLERFVEKIRDFSRYIKLQATEKYKFIESYKNITSKLEEKQIEASTNGVVSLNDIPDHQTEKYDELNQCISKLDKEVFDLLNNNVLQNWWTINTDTSRNEILKTYPWLECITSDVKSIKGIFERLQKQFGRSALDQLVLKNEKKNMKFFYQRIQTQLTLLTEHRKSLHCVLTGWLSLVENKKELISSLREEVCIAFKNYDQCFEDEKLQFEKIIPSMAVFSQDNFDFKKLDLELNELYEDLHKVIEGQGIRIEQLQGLYNDE